MREEQMTEMAGRLAVVPGVVGVSLGGSRARGTHTPDSDTDLGVYYDAALLDPVALQELATVYSDRPATVAGPGGWGPWVDGGAWLTIDGAPVDWILRDVSRVEEAVETARAGRFAVHAQRGHPYGFLDVSYAGELALGVLLADPSGRLGDLRGRVDPYPEALRRALVEATSEADFLVLGARKVARRGDTAYVAQSLSRALLVCAHGLMADDRRWALNEKGLVAEAATGTNAPVDLVARATTVLRELADPERLVAACADAAALVAEIRGSLGPT